MFNNDLVFVYDNDVKETTVYTFTPDDSQETFLSVKARIEQNQNETEQRWFECYGESWRKNWLETFGYEFDKSYMNMRIISYSEFEKLENEKYESKPLHEITEERFMDLLECLPPVKWSSSALFESFFMSEAYTGNWRDQVMRITVDGENRYFTKLRTFDNAFNYDDLIQAMGVNK